MYMPQTTPEPLFILEPNKMSDQVHEPATLPVPMGVLVEYEGMEWTPVSTAKVEVSALNSVPLIILQKFFFCLFHLPAPSLFHRPATCH